MRLGGNGKLSTVVILVNIYHVLNDVIHDVEERDLGHEIVTTENHNVHKIIDHAASITLLYPLNVIGHFADKKLG